jgi:hypothetical protein
MKKEAVVFALIFVGMTWVIEALHLPYADEIWLISGIVAAFVLYWIRPNSEEGYLRSNGAILLVVFVAYIIVIKAPKLFLGIMNYRLAQLLCLLIYLSCCWFIVKKEAADS